MCIDQCLCVNRSQIKSVHHIKRFCLYTRLDLNCSIHMDYFYDVFMNVKVLVGMDVKWRDRNLSGLIKNIFVFAYGFGT